MKSFKIFTAIVFILTFSYLTFGQGDSDPGFCTITILKPYNTDGDIIDNYSQIKFGLSNGSVDHDINIWGSYFEYRRTINKKFCFDIKLQFISRSEGNLSVSGLSDIFFNANYSGVKNALFTLGLKVPLSDGNILKDGLSLPMAYQTGLGTFDLIIGGVYTIKKITLALALQQPLTQNNNGFLVYDYPRDSELREFISTNQYIRKGDLLFRAAYPLKIGKKLRIIPGILAIYHLGDDEFTTPRNFIQKIDGSAGLTLNGNLFILYFLDETNIVELSIGAPFITRTARPDGLTRSYIATVEYKFRF